MLRSTYSTRTEPDEEPVSIPQLRSACRITQKVHDAELAAFIVAARQDIENAHLWRALITQTCIDRFNSFGEMELKWSPVSSITSIGYTDTDEASQTVASTVYELGQENDRGIVRLQYNQTWPTDVIGHPDAVTVTYVAGYGSDAEDVPQPIRQAIIFHAGWQHREREGENYPARAIASLLGPYITQRAT